MRGHVGFVWNRREPAASVSAEPPGRPLDVARRVMRSGNRSAAETHGSRSRFIAAYQSVKGARATLATFDRRTDGIVLGNPGR